MLPYAGLNIYTEALSWVHSTSVGQGSRRCQFLPQAQAKMQLGLPSHKQWLSTLRAEHVKQRPCRPAGTRTRACDVSERGWHAHDACACSCHVVSTDGHEASLARRRRRLMRLVHVVPAHRSRQRRGGARHVGANFREAGLRCISPRMHAREGGYSCSTAVEGGQQHLLELVHDTHCAEKPPTWRLFVSHEARPSD